MYIIGIAGGSGSGKTSVVKKIINSFPDESVRILSQDAYYKDNGILTQEEREKINFDHPDSIEFPLLREHLQELTAGEAIEMPTYSYITCTRQKDTIPIEPGKVIIVEGILIFTDSELRDMIDLKVFVDTEADERIIRIIQRDVNERGRGLDKSIQHYKRFVKPMHEIFIEPSKKYADIIIPEGGHNTKGIDILISKIKLMLHEA
jgi:uridine kinase